MTRPKLWLEFTETPRGGDDFYINLFYMYLYNFMGASINLANV